MESALKKTLEEKSVWARKVLSAAAVLIIVCVGVYFRSYELRPHQEIPEDQRRILAETRIRETLQDQILRQIEASGSQLPPKARKSLAERQAQTLIQSDQHQFEEAAARLAETMPGAKKSGSSRRYLLEADPYHYLAQVQTLLESGRIAE